MILFIQNRRKNLLYRIFSLFLAVAFAASLIAPTASYAQTAPQTILNLPVPGTMVAPGPVFTPPLIQGMTIHPDNPLEFDFIVTGGDKFLDGSAFNEESKKLIKYFLASLTVPEDELWVNLSPYEKDRIIPDSFGQTEMGRDLLAQDYILKQLSASLMYPEEDLGRKFWDRVREKARTEYGTTEIPMDTFNKIWIVPEKAVVHQNGPNVFVLESRLKVMLEEDYLALEKNLDHAVNAPEGRKMNAMTSAVVRELLIPEIEKEVNEGKTFANLRQIFHSMILATWYKQNLKEGLLGKIYVDQNKIEGVDVEDKQVKDKIYAQYVESLKKGVYNYIKEDYDPVTKSDVPRKYFSGGVVGKFAIAGGVRQTEWLSPGQARDILTQLSDGRSVHVRLAEVSARDAWELQERTIDRILQAAHNPAVKWITAERVTGDETRSDRARYETINEVRQFLTDQMNGGFNRARYLLYHLEALLNGTLPPNPESGEAPGIYFLKLSEYEGWMIGEVLPQGHASDRGIHLSRLESRVLLHELISFLGLRHEHALAYEIAFEAWKKTGDSFKKKNIWGQLRFNGSNERFYDRLTDDGIDGWRLDLEKTFYDALNQIENTFRPSGKRPADLLARMSTNGSPNRRDMFAGDKSPNDEWEPIPTAVTITDADFNELVEMRGRGEAGLHKNVDSTPVVPASEDAVLSWNQLSDSEKDRLKRKEREMYEQGLIAPVIMVGGEATRFGGPKTFVKVSDELGEFLGIKAENLRWVRQEFGTDVPMFLLSSDKRIDEFRQALAEREFYGLPPDAYQWFIQGTVNTFIPTEEEIAFAFKGEEAEKQRAWASRLRSENPDGVYRFQGEERRVPAGHLDAVSSFIISGKFSEALARGIEYVPVFNIDNLQAVLKNDGIIAHFAEQDGDFGFLLAEKNLAFTVTHEDGTEVKMNVRFRDNVVSFDGITEYQGEAVKDGFRYVINHQDRRIDVFDAETNAPVSVTQKIKPETGGTLVQPVDENGRPAGQPVLREGFELAPDFDHASAPFFNTNTVILRLKSLLKFLGVSQEELAAMNFEQRSELVRERLVKQIKANFEFKKHTVDGEYPQYGAVKDGQTEITVSQVTRIMLQTAHIQGANVEYYSLSRAEIFAPVKQPEDLAVAAENNREALKAVTLPRITEQDSREALRQLKEAALAGSVDELPKDNRYREYGFDKGAPRLGWLNAPSAEDVRKNLEQFAQKASGMRHMIFIGMGGSINTVKALNAILGENSGINIYAYDQMDPAALEEIRQSIGDELDLTLVVSISKSATTKETHELSNNLRDLFENAGLDVADHYLWMIDMSKENELAKRGWDGVETIPIQVDRKEDVGGRNTAPMTNIFFLPLLTLVDFDYDVLYRYEQFTDRMDELQELAARKAREVYNTGSPYFAIYTDEGSRQALETWFTQLVQESLGGKIGTLNPKTTVASEQRPAPNYFTRIDLPSDEDPVLSMMLGTYFMEVFTALIAHHYGLNPITQDNVEIYKRKMRELAEASIPDAETVGLQGLIERIRQTVTDSHKFVEVVLYGHASQAQLDRIQAYLAEHLKQKVFVFVGSDWNHHSYQGAPDNGETLFVIATKERYTDRIEGVSQERIDQNIRDLRVIAYATYETLQDKALYLGLNIADPKGEPRKEYSFSPGPAMLPASVWRAKREMMGDENKLDLSERTFARPEYNELQQRVKAKLRGLMGIPDNYDVLLLPQPATSAYAMVARNLMARTGDGSMAYYVTTGVWSKNALAAAREIAAASPVLVMVNEIASSEATNFDRLPHLAVGFLRKDDKVSYVHLTWNNTVYGTRWPDLPETNGIPMVLDATSDILSQRIPAEDWRNIGVIYAGAQKNIGLPGFSVLIVRKDLVDSGVLPGTPKNEQFSTWIGATEYFVTPPTDDVMTLDLVLDEFIARGGVEAMEQENRIQAKMVYDVIDSSNGFYRGLVIVPEHRSIMNVTFRLADESLTDRFHQEAAAAGLYDLKGFPEAKGGPKGMTIRASIYNGMPRDGVERLVKFMRDFQLRVTAGDPNVPPTDEGVDRVLTTADGRVRVIKGPIYDGTDGNPDRPGRKSGDPKLYDAIRGDMDAMKQQGATDVCVACSTLGLHDEKLSEVARDLGLRYTSVAGAIAARYEDTQERVGVIAAAGAEMDVSDEVKRAMMLQVPHARLLEGDRLYVPGSVDVYEEILGEKMVPLADEVTAQLKGKTAAEMVPALVKGIVAMGVNEVVLGRPDTARLLDAGLEDALKEAAPNVTLLSFSDITAQHLLKQAGGENVVVGIVGVPNQDGIDLTARELLRAAEKTGSISAQAGETSGEIDLSSVLLGDPNIPPTDRGVERVLGLLKEIIREPEDDPTSGEIFGGYMRGNTEERKVLLNSLEEMLREKAGMYRAESNLDSPEFAVFRRNAVKKFIAMRLLAKYAHHLDDLKEFLSSVIPVQDTDLSGVIDRLPLNDEDKAAVLKEAQVLLEDVAENAGSEENPGGIDLDPAMLNLQIRMDENGIPLPVNEQPVHLMHIDGFVPVIINVVPVTNMPMLLGIKEAPEDKKPRRAQIPDDGKITRNRFYDRIEKLVRRD